MVYDNGYVYGGYYGPSYAQLEALSLKQRAQAIEDMFGATPESLGEFRKQHEGSHWGKAIAYAIGGIAVGAVATALIPVLATTAIAALVISGFGLCGAVISITADESRSRAAYTQYLSGFATKARLEHEKQLAAAKGVTADAPAQEQPAKQGKQWTADVAAQRAHDVAAAQAK